MSDMSRIDERGSVAVILVNYNNQDDTVECVKSISKSSLLPLVVVVDNDSERKNLEDLLSFYTNLIVIYNKSNVGFARANNIGINWVMRNTGCDFIFILNNDTIINADTIDVLIAGFQKDAMIAITTCKIVYKNAPDIVWYGGGSFNWHKASAKICDYRGRARENGANQERYVEFASACAMMFSREHLSELTGFDERFFMYGEDLEMSLRVHMKGHLILYLAQTRILHKVHGSIGADEKSELPALHPRNPKLDFYIRNMLANRIMAMLPFLSGKKKIYFYFYQFLFFIKYGVVYLLNGRFQEVKSLCSVARKVVKSGGL